MASEARKAGVPEIWGGNYGVLSPEGAILCDRVFTGYAEHKIAELLRVPFGNISHPPLIGHLKLGNILSLIPIGIIFTSRGCNRMCTFCQTPVFCDGGISTIPLDSLFEVIELYKRMRVGAILILDECFGSIPEHANQVVQLLDEAAIPWLPMTRADIIMSNLASWNEQGMAGAFLGIESFREKNLKQIRKGGDSGLTKKLIKRLHATDRLIVGYYIIGFEEDDPESLTADMHELVSLNLDITQVCILTPFHQTPMWDQLSVYGIHDSDLSKFDGKHLVWNHPNFTAVELEGTLQEFFANVCPSRRDTDTIRRFSRQLIKRVGMGAGLSFLAGTLLRANSTSYFDSTQR